MANKVDVIQIYTEYYIERDYEQIDLFRLLRNRWAINSAVYPGSYVQISPAFIYPKVVFIDTDKKARKFFKDERVIPYISSRKEYDQEPDVSFYPEDYREPIEGLRGRFDLLISQYAGFISNCCKEYLRTGGYLLVNNSHGDAGLASIDQDYEFIAAVKKANGKYRLSYSNLKDYFIPKKDLTVTREYLYETGKGVGYRKTAPLYLFRLKQSSFKFKSSYRLAL